MKKLTIVLSTIASTVFLNGCGTLNNDLVGKQTETEYFRVYDIPTNAPARLIAEAASNGIGKDITGMNSTFPLMDTSGVVPEKASYMQLVNPLQGSALSALAGGAGNLGIKVAQCNGAVWTSNARTNFNGYSGKYFALCLFPYQGGYQLDIYGDLKTRTGGSIQAAVNGALINSVLGDPTEFMDKAFNDTLQAIHEAIPNAPVQYVRGQPEPGPLPWIAGTTLAK